MGSPFASRHRSRPVEPGRRLGPAVLALLAGGALAAPLALSPEPARADPSTVPLDQSGMTVLDTDSAEPDSPAENVLDGEVDTIWHTAWQNGKAPLPHHLTIRISDEPVDVAAVRLQGRTSSNGSGRIRDYDLLASNDPSCSEDSFALVTSGGFDGALATATSEKVITVDQPVQARCLTVVWKTSWGGRSSDPVNSPPETVASLAEFNVDVLGEPGPGDPITVDPPEGTVEITDGSLHVRLHPDFPQVVDYRLGGSTVAGRYGAALSKVTIDDVSRPVDVAAPVVAADGASATYRITVPSLSDVSFDAVLSVRDGVFTWSLTDVEDPRGLVHRIAVPRLDLASAHGGQEGAQLTTADITTDRRASGDRTYDLASQQPGTAVSDPTYLALLTTPELAAGFETNAVEDNTAGGATAERVRTDNSRLIATIAQGDGASYGTVSPGTFVVRGSTADLGIGPDEDPYVRVRLTPDANDDGTLT